MFSITSVILEDTWRSDAEFLRTEKFHTRRCCMKEPKNNIFTKWLNSPKRDISIVGLIVISCCFCYLAMNMQNLRVINIKAFEGIIDFYAESIHGPKSEKPSKKESFTVNPEILQSIPENERAAFLKEKMRYDLEQQKINSNHSYWEKVWNSFIVLAVIFAFVAVRFISRVNYHEKNNSDGSTELHVQCPEELKIQKCKKCQIREEKEDVPKIILP